MLVFLEGCSSESFPPEIGGCVPTDAAGCISAVGGGVSTGGGVGGGDGSVEEMESGVGVCNAGSSASRCDVCAYASCCAQLMTCEDSGQCHGLLNCVMGCASSACIDGCNQAYPESVTSSLDTFESCVTLKCPICSESGVGDPCGPGGNACVAGLACNGLWCTKGCVQTSDCIGIGPNGGNFTGYPSACIASTQGDLCTPGCGTTADCSDLPNSLCLSTMSLDRLAVSICSTVPDGG